MPCLYRKINLPCALSLIPHFHHKKLRSACTVAIVMGAEGMGMKTVICRLCSPCSLRMRMVDAQENAAAGSGCLGGCSLPLDRAAVAPSPRAISCRSPAPSRSSSRKRLRTSTWWSPAESITDVSTARLDESARLFGADSWLSILADGGWANLRLSVAFLRPRCERGMLETTVTRTGWTSFAGPRFGGIARDRSTDSRPLPRIAAVTATAEGVRLAMVTVKAPTGNEDIRSGRKSPDRRPERLSDREMPVSRQYELGAVLPGHFFSRQVFFLTADRTVSFVQKPESAWSLDASFEDRAYPGLSVGWSPVPGLVTLRLGVQTFLFGLAFDATGVFQALPSVTYSSSLKPLPWQSWANCAPTLRSKDSSGSITLRAAIPCLTPCRRAG